MTGFTKQYSPPGTSPGALVRRDPGSALDGQTQIEVVRYTQDEMRVDRYDEIAMVPMPDVQSETVWIQMHGPVSPAVLEQFRTVLNIHSLALEDILNTGQRPKVDEYEGLTLVFLKLPWITETGEIKTSQVSLIVSNNMVVSFIPDHDELFEPLRARMQSPSSRLRQSDSSYLFHALLDLIVDHAFPILERLDDDIQSIEETVMNSDPNSALNQLHTVRRELLVLRKVLWPQRELIGRLISRENDWVGKDLDPYLKDCYDHTVQMIDLVETYREIAGGIFDLYLSKESKRMNESVRVLTVIATIFMPLTFIVGVYGMNFSAVASDGTPIPWAMPELHWSFGYPLVWLLMIGITVGMIVFFKRKRWL